MTNNKKSSIRYIDDNTALVTKAFQKNASIFGTDEFKLWREYKAMFHDAKMTTKTIKKKYSDVNDYMDFFEELAAKNAAENDMFAVPTATNL